MPNQAVILLDAFAIDPVCKVLRKNLPTAHRM